MEMSHDESKFTHKHSPFGKSVWCKWLHFCSDELVLESSSWRFKKVPSEIIVQKLKKVFLKLGSSPAKLIKMTPQRALHVAFVI